MGANRIVHTTVAVATLLALLLDAIRLGEPTATNLLASLFLTGIVVSDATTLKIPNPLILTATIMGLAANTYLGAVQGITMSLLGMTVGLLLLFPLYLCGGMGAGDVKAMAALGSFTGPAIILQIFLYTALIGGVLSLLHYCCTHDACQKLRAMCVALRALPYSAAIQHQAPDANGRDKRLPYAAAIALGFIAFRHWGPVVSLSW